MADPLLFISHKHKPPDNRIAQAIATFVEAWSNAGVKVHLSSDPDFQGPRFGKGGLNNQLKQALWNTDVLILVYTSADQDWSYCMWECGVASDSQSPDTNIIVFQCGSDIPAPFQDDLRVNARNYDHLKRFAQQFLREPDFFPSLQKALAPALRDALVEQAAKELQELLSGVLPRLDEGLVVEWPTWPYLRIELPRSEVDRMEQASESERAGITQQIVKSFGEVVDSDARVAQLFGQAVLPSRVKLSALLSAWQSKYPGAEAAWFDSCCEQIMLGAGRGFPIIRWTPVREVGGDAEFTPVLSRVRRIPFSEAVQFDLYFYNLSDPRAVPVTSKMIPLGEFFYKNLGEITPESLKLKDLIAELDLRRLNRIPMFNGEGHPLYIIHRSMVDKFIVKHVLASADSKSPGDLTLSDLLADREMKDIFENTFVLVKRQATISEARSAMLTKPGCSDVFVTAGGSRNEPVQGWLTNVDIARSS